MTAMELTELLKLGFNKNEAQVYLILIKFVKADAGQIIKETHFHKNIVYDNLEKLINKGLVSYIIENKRKVFQITSSTSLIDYFENEEKKLNEKKKEAEKITKEINKIARQLPSTQEAMVFRGVRGVKNFYYEGVKQNQDTLAFGAPQESIDIMGEIFWRNLQVKRQEKNVHAKLIFNPSIKEYGESIKNPLTEVRYFERDFEPMSETHIQGDEVGIIVWTKEPILFLIKDKLVAESYRKFFEKMWKQARK
jgi:sugar-specific transcriptional regulator TrmB